MKKTIPDASSGDDESGIIERPDGFYWFSATDERTYGPFATRRLALQDMRYREDVGAEAGETLEDAETELGLSTWIDPDTGEPAEEGVPRLEDH